MKCSSLRIFTVLFSIPIPTQAATTVDWLNLAPGATAAAFFLTEDGGLPVSSGAISILNQNGIVFPGFPTATAFGSGFWSEETGFLDSVTGTDQVGTFDIRVAPVLGNAAYSVALDVPAGRELVLAIGGLYRDGLGATGSVAITTSEGGMVSFIRSVGWDGAGLFDQELEWDTLTSTLSTTLGADGDSKIAFLRISPLSGLSPRITLSVPNGYAFGSGESISIGIGTVIPELGTLALASLGAIFLLTGRRRSVAK